MPEAMSQIFPMLVSAILASGTDEWQNAKTKYGATVLHRHAQAGHAKICRKLIELGCDVNAVDQYGRTPLHYVFNGAKKWMKEPEKKRFAETCLVLIDCGADLEQTESPPQKSYLRHAAKCDLYEAYDAILDQGVKPDLSEHAGNLLCSASSHGRRDRIKQLLQWGADIDARDDDNSTALHHAVRRRDFETCKFLLENGADVHSRDDKEQTPLFELFGSWAIHAQAAHYESIHKEALPVLQLLLKNGADPDAVANETTFTSFGGTVLEVFKGMPQNFRDELARY